MIIAKLSTLNYPHERQSCTLFVAYKRELELLQAGQSGAISVDGIEAADTREPNNQTPVYLWEFLVGGRDLPPPVQSLLSKASRLSCL